MAKRYSILLLFSLALPLLGCFVFLKIQKQRIKKEIKRHLMAEVSNKQLVTLSFTLKEAKQHLKWEHEKEFEYQGKMYDVVRKEIKGDIIVYHCWWDHEETALNQKLRQLTYLALNQNPTRKNQETSLVQFFKNLVSPPQKSDLAINFSVKNHQNIFRNYPTLLGESNLVVPPPQFG